MPNNEWKEITDPEELFKLKREGWEIEFIAYPTSWEEWMGRVWSINDKFRARPRQPKMKKVRMLCWFDKSNISWWVEEETETMPKSWIRVPSEDREIEVPDGQ